jgi:exopolysaccharide biosynthesis predicted pyruvyltransferase EpsI
MILSEHRSPFREYMEGVKHRKTYFLELEHGNNGDHLIAMGIRRVLKEANTEIVDCAQAADQIVMDGGGRFQDAFPRAFEIIARHRRNYPSIPLIMAPQVFRVERVDFRGICAQATSPLILFARDHFSAASLREADLPVYCEVHLSQDPAFELSGSSFIMELIETSSEKHVLIAMRKDEFIADPDSLRARFLHRAKGTWLPKSIRRPLSMLRDRVIARVSGDAITVVLEQEKVARGLPKIYRDISVSISFPEFVAAVRDAAVVITDRLHVAVFAYLLRKRVVILCEQEYLWPKLKGVYDFSMSAEGSRTTLYVPGG